MSAMCEVKKTIAEAARDAARDYFTSWRFGLLCAGLYALYMIATQALSS